MHASSSPMGKPRGRFPAVMRHKLRQQSKTTRIGSIQNAPMETMHDSSEHHSETMYPMYSKNTQRDRGRDDHLPQPVEEANANNSTECAMPNSVHIIASEPTRTSMQPIPPIHAPVVFPPNPHRLTHPYRHNPPHFYAFHSPPAPALYSKGHRTDISVMIGNPSLNIHRLRLPRNLIHLLDSIVLGCEAYAATQPNGWHTDLYSLTKQDVALREIPELYLASLPIVAYITKCMRQLWGVEQLTMDKNQPHVLKYADGHTGVELHHDKCDITANVCLSRTMSYVGGGTYFPDAREVVRLDFGEFLLHPGSLVHSGADIGGGTRHLMVLFAQISQTKK